MVTVPNPHEESEISLLRAEVKALRDDVSELLDTWRAARGVLAFVKWTVTLMMPALALWSFVRGIHKN